MLKKPVLCLWTYIYKTSFHLLQASLQNFSFSLGPHADCFHISLHSSTEIRFPQFISYITYSVGISNLWIVNEQVNKLCLFSGYYWCYHECNLHSSIGLKNAEKQAEWNKRKEVLLDTSSYQMHFQN